MFLTLSQPHETIHLCKNISHKVKNFLTFSRLCRFFRERHGWSKTVYVTPGETHGEKHARQLKSAHGSGHPRGLWAYKTPQGIPCHQSDCWADMIGANCEKFLWGSMRVAEWKLECSRVQVAKTQHQVLVMDTHILRTLGSVSGQGRPRPTG